MLLYNYSPASSHTSINVRVHDGQGLGSLFAKIFSKVAVKAAAKTAAKAVGTVARKGIKIAGKAAIKGVKIAGREGLNLAKDIGRDVGKDLIKTGVDLGTNLALQGIDSLAQKATNSHVPTKLVQSVTNHARGKTLAGATVLEQEATKQLKRLTHHPKKRKAISQPKSKPKKKKKTTDQKTSLSGLISDYE